MKSPELNRKQNREGKCRLSLGNHQEMGNIGERERERERARERAIFASRAPDSLTSQITGLGELSPFSRDSIS